MASQSQSLFDPYRATASGLYIKVNKLYSEKLTSLVLLFHGEAGITATHLTGSHWNFSEATAYEWRSKTGLIKYHFHPTSSPDTERDSLALGLITPVTEAVLLRIDSATSNDYLELEIVSSQNFSEYSLLSQTIFSVCVIDFLLGCGMSDTVPDWRGSVRG